MLGISLNTLRGIIIHFGNKHKELYTQGKKKKGFITAARLGMSQE